MYSRKYYKTSKLYEPRCNLIHPGLYKTSDYCAAYWVNNDNGPKYAWETVLQTSVSTVMICYKCGDEG